MRLMTLDELRHTIRDVIAETLAVAPSVTRDRRDAQVLRLLTKAFRMPVRLEDVHAIRITSATRRGVGLEDVGRTLGHMYTMVSAEDLAATKMTSQELAEWIVKNGGAKKRRLKRRNRPGPMGDFD